MLGHLAISELSASFPPDSRKDKEYKFFGGGVYREYCTLATNSLQFFCPIANKLSEQVLTIAKTTSHSLSAGPYME